MSTPRSVLLGWMLAADSAFPCETWGNKGSLSSWQSSKEAKEPELTQPRVPRVEIGSIFQRKHRWELAC